MTEFEQELSSLINRHSQENVSNTPDFLLARFLVGCLDSYNEVALQRDRLRNDADQKQLFVSDL